MSGSRSLFGILLTRIARLFFASGQGVFLPVWPSGGGCHAHGSADQAPPRLRFRHLRERGSRGKDPLQSSSILFNPLQSFSIAPPSIQHGSRPDPRFGSLSGSADPDQDRRTGAVPVSGPDQDRLGEDVRGDPRAPILIRIVGGGRRAILFSIPIRIGSRPCRSPAMAGRGGILIRIDPAPSRTIPLQRNVSEIPILSSRIVPKKRKK